MYQKLVIGEANAQCACDVSRLEQKTTAKKKIVPCACGYAASGAKATVKTKNIDAHGTLTVIRPDRMIICSDWPTTLRYGITFGYKKGDSRD
jgi:hypothetical protein